MVESGSQKKGGIKRYNEAAQEFLDCLKGSSFFDSNNRWMFRFRKSLVFDGFIRFLFECKAKLG